MASFSTLWAGFRTRNTALGYPHFRQYIGMRFGLILALHMQFTIVNYWVYKISGDDVLAVGKLGLWEAIPAVLCSLFSGHIVDQNEKKKMLFICFGGYILLSVCYAVLSMEATMASLGVSRIELLIYAATFVNGVLRAFVSPSAFALMGTLTPREHYGNASTWSSTAWQTGAVLGPVVGGFFLSLFPFSVGLWAAVAIQVIALVPLLGIPKRPVLQKAREPVLKSIKEGMRFLMNTQVLLAALSLDMFAVLFGGAIALLPVYKETLKLTGLEYGWLQAAPGIGTIITLFIISAIPLKTAPGPKMLLSIAGFGIATIFFAVSGSFWVALVALLFTGIFDGVSVAIRGMIVQIKTPDAMRGRIAAVNTMFISSSNEIGRAESGLTAKLMGTVPAVVFGGVMTLVVVGITWIVAPALRKLDLSEGMSDE